MKYDQLIEYNKRNILDAQRQWDSICEITLVRLSVCPSVHHVRKFSQNWIISLFLILYMMIADYDI